MLEIIFALTLALQVIYGAFTASAFWELDDRPRSWVSISTTLTTIAFAIVSPLGYITTSVVFVAIHIILGVQRAGIERD